MKKAFFIRLASRRSKRETAARWVAGLLTLVVFAGADADAPRVAIAPPAGSSNVFGGEPVEFPFVVTSAEAVRGRAGWVVSIDRRTIARGEQDLSVDPGRPAPIVIRWDVPPARDGIVVEARLSAVFDGVTRDVPLWIFPRDPFAGRVRGPGMPKLVLFDPERTTAPILEGMGLSFTSVRGSDAFEGLTDCVLVVGEGTSLDEFRGLADRLVQTAERGLTVLCLAPSAARFPLPGAEGVNGARPPSLCLRGREVIRQLDKRLETRSWPPDGRVIASTIALTSERERVVGTVSPGPGSGGWPWFEAEYPESRGRLIVCGFAIVRHWESGPTPRYLFARILESITEKNEDSAREILNAPRP